MLHMYMYMHLYIYIHMPILVGGFSPIHLKNMRTVKLDSISPNSGEQKKYSIWHQHLEKWYQNITGTPFLPQMTCEQKVGTRMSLSIHLASEELACLVWWWEIQHENPEVKGFT